jgi:hypothetical protein
MDFLYSFLGRAIAVSASYLAGIFLSHFPKIPNYLGLDKDSASVVIALVLFFIAECFFVLRPKINLQKTQKRMAKALFDEWPNQLTYEDDNSVVPGIRINVMLFKWTFIPNFSTSPFKKWTIVYRSKGKMEKASDRDIKFKIYQGCVGAACKTTKGGIAHFKDLQLPDEEKKKFLKSWMRKGGLGMNGKQVRLTEDVKAIVTVLLVEGGKTFGAFNVDAVETNGAEALGRSNVQEAIVKLSDYAEKIYGTDE